MIIGIDISEKNNVSAWGDLAKNKIRFAYLKCTDGITSSIPRYASDKKNAKENGMLVGAYHWLNPRQDAAAQAEYFIKNASPSEDDLPPVVCLELYTTTKVILEPKLKTFVETVETHTAKRPILYTSSAYWKKYMSDVEWCCDYPLWIDEPGTIWPNQLYPWAGWTFWQYSYQTRLPGVSGTPGLNFFNGSFDELQALTTEGIIKR